MGDDQVMRGADALDGAARPSRSIPAIDIAGGDLAPIVDDLVGRLAAAGVIYRRAGVLVRPVRAAEVGLRDRGITRDPGAIVIAPIGADAVRVALGRLVQFRRWGDRGARIVDCPRDYAAAIVGLGDWPGVPALAGVAHAPVMRADGTIAQSQGYDPETGMYIDMGDGWPAVPDAPTEAQARAAIAELLDPVSEFPVSDDADRAAIASAILSRLVISMLPTCPAHWIVAPDAGAGKTLLADVISMIATGSVAAKRTLPADEDETRKMITACLLAGDGQITLDNVARGSVLRSAVLDAALTSGVWSDRVLGASVIMTMPFRVMVVVTGNNIAPHGDAVRRGIYCRLDPRVEQPEAREFRVPDLLGHLDTHRRRLVVAGLTILRAYVVAGRPCALSPLGSYEVWSRTVREAIVWLDMHDPVLTQRTMRVADDDRSDAGELLAALVGAYDDAWVTAAEVHARCYPDWGDGDPALRRAMRCDDGRTISAKSMGRRLRAHVGRIVADRRIEAQADAHRGCMRYRVTAI